MKKRNNYREAHSQLARGLPRPDRPRRMVLRDLLEEVELAVGEEAESGCHPFLLRVEQGGVLVVHIADPRIGCVDLQCGFRKGAEQVNGRPFHLAAV